VVTRSSAVAEFRAMAQGVCEILWLKILLKELGFDSKDLMRLYCDNKAAISIAHNPVQHDRTKHVEIDRHFIKEKLREGIIYTPYVKTGELVDILTNRVSSGVHIVLCNWGMRDIYAPS
jgi:ATP sulfurylase